MATMTASNSKPSPSTGWILDGSASNVEDNVSCVDGETGPGGCYVDEINRCQDLTESCNDHSARNKVISIVGITDSGSGCYKYDQERTTMMLDSSSSNNIDCILCMECIGGRDLLQQHLLEVHKVKAETLQGIMKLVDAADLKVPLPLADGTRTPPPQMTSSEVKDKPHHMDDCQQSGGAYCNAVPSHHTSKFQQRAAEKMETENNEENVEAAIADQKMEEEREATCDDVTGVSPDNEDEEEEEEEEEEDNCRCHTCSKSFLTIDSLYSHQNELGHLELKQTSTGPGYLCWHKGCKRYFQTANAVQVHHRDEHVLQRRETMTTTTEQEEVHHCRQCNLSFKTIDRLQVHSYYHMIQSATDCIVCGRSFQTTMEVKKHMDACHIDVMSKEQMAQYQANVAAASSLALLGASGLDARIGESSSANHQTQGTSLSKQFSRSSISTEESRISKKCEENDEMKLDENSNASLMDGMEDGGSMMMKLHQQLDSADEYYQNHADGVNYTVNKYKCHRCKVGFPKMSYLSAHNKTLQHRQGSKLSHPLEKYFDPNRPHKCDVCMESFTQKNILLVHYNSVSHLHRLKQQQQHPMPSSSSMSGDDRNGHDLYMNDDMPAENVSSNDVEMMEDESKSEAVLESSGAPLLSNLSIIMSVDKTTIPMTTACPGSPSADGALPNDPVVTETRGSVVTETRGSTDMTTICSVDNLNAADVSSKAVSDVTDETYSCTPCSASYSNRSSYEAHLCSILHMKRSTRFAPETSNLFPTSSSGAPFPRSSTSSQMNENVIKFSSNFNDCLPFQHQQRMFNQSASVQSPTSLSSTSAAFQQPLIVFPGLPAASVAAGGHLSVLTSSSRTSGHSSSSQLSTFGQQQLRLSSATTTLNNSNNATDSSSSLRSQNHHHNNNSNNYSSNNYNNSNNYNSEDAWQQYSRMQTSACNNSFEFSVQQHQYSAVAPTATMTHVVRTGPSSVRQDGQKPSHHIQHTLLQNYGFECVMQFNEYRQKTKKDATESSSENADRRCISPSVKSENVDKIEDTKNVDLVSVGTSANLPELVKCWCCLCSKEFSSVWVLKSHEEEVHKELLPTNLIHEFGKRFRKHYNSRHVSQETTRGIAEASSKSSQVGKRHEHVTESSDVVFKTSDEMRSRGGGGGGGMLSELTAAKMMQQLPLMMGLNLLPPMPMMMPLGAELFGLPPFPLMDPSMLMMSQQQHQQNQKAAAAAASAVAMAAAAQQNANAQQQQPKSARTRITDEQLSILRAHFDINNSPSEEQIRDMSEKTGLPPKVIKHWFRNTLFKERQRNKDSPYNFSIPPSTTLNLEEYERLTQSLMKKERPSQENKDSKISSSAPAAPPLLSSQETQHQSTVRVKSEAGRSSFEMQSDLREYDVHRSSAATNATPISVLNSPGVQGGSRMTFHPPLLNSTGDISAAMLSNLMQMSPLYLPSPMLQQGVTTPNNMAKLNLSQVPSFGGSSASSLQERRANRTRFTKNQIHVLQEFFEQNAYPKDDELENLSKILDLSPRVIVVWFQNARQKVRKNFENQPAIDMSDEGGATVQLPTGSTYQCKKCLALFPHYDELVRHKRSVCFKDEENYHLSVSNSAVSYDVTDDDDDDRFDSRSHSSVDSSEPKSALSFGGTGPGIEYCCEKCNLIFYSLEKWKEHQSIHAASLGLAVPQGSSSSATSSSLGMIKNRSYERDRSLEVGEGGGGGYCNNSAMLNDESSVMKQWSDDGDDRDDQPRDKRIRTTILPEQLDYLYSKYQLDCNPSRKQLDAIASRVGLKKRVVQVWFQNTRARERKGQYRAHQQLIHKRCPFCKALFRAKTALEAHLTSKHPEETAGREISIDGIPDEPIETVLPSTSDSPIHHSTPVGSNLNLMKMTSSSAYAMTNPFLPVISPPVRSLNTADLVQANMQRLYEDSFKKYIDELSHVSHQTKAEATSSAIRGPETSSGMSTTRTKMRQDDSPLDLSMSIRSSILDRRSFDDSATTTSGGHQMLTMMTQDDSRSESHSDNNDEYSFAGGESTPPSPSSSTSNQSKQMFGIPGKRYRTQMSSIQIKVMKSVFVDYKTPTMSECDALGHEIGLPKRVIQVWFQNARAKEKKCTLESPGISPVSASLPSLPSLASNYCSLCDVSYSLQHTVQDHLFTKKHIDKIKTNLRSQKEAAAAAAANQNQAREIADVPRRSKLNETKNNMSTESQQSHVPSGTSSAALVSAFQSQGVEKKQRIKSLDVTSTGHKVKIEEGEPMKNCTSAVSMSSLGGPVASSTAGHLLNPFSGFPVLPVPSPVDIMTMMPYLYPCLTGFYPGSGMPFMPTAPMMPGLDNMFMYDPVNFGTPLKLLQIPAACIKKIQEKLQDKDCAVTFYSQDCHSFSDLKRSVPHDDWSVARKVTIDVGYICRKCHIVYPGRAACVSHQQATCYQGFQNSGVDGTILKLEQLQYDCSVCGIRCSTIAEYKAHCAQDLHKHAISSAKGHSISKKFTSSTSVPTIMPSTEGQARLESTPAAGGSGSTGGDDNSAVKMEQN